MGFVLFCVELDEIIFYNLIIGSQPIKLFAQLLYLAAKYSAGSR